MGRAMKGFQSGPCSVTAGNPLGRTWRSRELCSLNSNGELVSMAAVREVLVLRMLFEEIGAENVQLTFEQGPPNLQLFGSEIQLVCSHGKKREDFEHLVSRLLFLCLHFSFMRVF